MALVSMGGYPVDCVSVSAHTWSRSEGRAFSDVPTYAAGFSQGMC
jgi:hypothetical protein